MRLYFAGARAEFESALREDWYSEWSIGSRPCIPLCAVAVTPAPDPAVIVEMPYDIVLAYARGGSRPGQYLVPKEVVMAFYLGTTRPERSRTAPADARGVMGLPGKEEVER